MKQMILAATAAVAVLFNVTAAQASRTVVDQIIVDPTDPSQDITVTETLGGYCDLNGADCNARPLGYTVDFGNGNVVDSFIVYGNGLFTFGPNPVDLSNYDNYDGTPGFFGGNAIDAGIDNSLDFQFGEAVFAQSANVLGDATSFNINYYQCASVFGCSLGNGSDGYGFYLSAEADGLYVTPYFTGLGISIPGVTPVPDGFGSFFIPAKVTSGSAGTGSPGTRDLPEPSSWALMIAGFAFAGGALRRRSTRAGAAIA